MRITEKEIESYSTFKGINKIRTPYKGSKFILYKNLSPRRKGAQLEKLFEELCINKGAQVSRSGSSDYDRKLIIGDNIYRVEIKSSLLWGEKGEQGMRWQQIRIDQDYDIIVFIAVFPERIDFFYADKKVVAKHVDVQDANGNYPYNQHGGKKTRSGTFLIHKLPKDIPFLKPLEELFNV